VSAPVPILSLEGVPAPDLVVTDLTVSAAGAIQSGDSVTVSWKDANIGTIPTADSWNDLVIVRSAQNAIIASVVVPYDATAGGPIAAGAHPRTGR
jgi:hypothetical protein